MGRELGTFGAILRFAIQLEEQAAAYYEAAGAPWAALALAHRKRQRECERVRREQVTEMILEPIYGLAEDDWALDLSQANAETAAKLEQTLGAFYTQAAGKVSVPQVGRSLRKLAQETTLLGSQASAI
jgi:hypothetical protein